MLIDQIDEIKRQPLSLAQQEESIIRLIQYEISRYSDFRWRSEHAYFFQEVAARMDVSNFEDQTGIADYVELSVSEIMVNKHMQCLMKNYLLGRFIKKFLGTDVYWVDVERNISLFAEGHVCVLARLSNGSYFLGAIVTGKQIGRAHV